jgi:hypothetical protein
MNLERLKNPIHLIKSIALKAKHGRLKTVPVDCILLGGEAGLSANQYARLVDDPLRPSTKFLDGPHWQLLCDYQTKGDAVFGMEAFKETSYYNNAIQVIELFGRYFSAESDDELLKIAKRFVLSFTGASSEDWGNEKDHTAKGRLIRVRPVKYSRRYAVLDGNHRLAGAIWNGAKHVKVRVSGPPQATPAQEMLLDVLWQSGRCELYQPVELPEVSEWLLVRRCTDRRDKMINFLEVLLDDRTGKTYCDLGCSYGWFVGEMHKHGYRSFGVERDPFALRIGDVVYGIDKERLFRSDVVRFVTRNQKEYDAVSFFSVIHHFLLAGEERLASTAMRHVDRMTREVLFFESGEEHEVWFEKRLRGWNEQKIMEWVLDNTSFSHCYRLGRDRDSVGKFRNNYSRMLFAFTRRRVSSDAYGHGYSRVSG